MWPIKKYVENNYIIMKEHDRMRRGWGGTGREGEREIRTFRNGNLFIR